MSGLPISLSEIQSYNLESPKDLEEMFSLDEMISFITFGEEGPVLQFWLIQMNPRLCDFAMSCADDVLMNNEGITGMEFIQKLYDMIYYRLSNPEGYFPTFGEDEEVKDTSVEVAEEQKCLNDLGNLPEFVVEILQLCGEYIRKPALKDKAESFIYLNVEELAERIMYCVENRDQEDSD